MTSKKYVWRLVYRPGAASVSYSTWSIARYDDGAKAMHEAMSRLKRSPSLARRVERIDVARELVCDSSVISREEFMQTLINHQNGFE